MRFTSRRSRGYFLPTACAVLLAVAVGETTAVAQPAAPGDLWRWSRFTRADGLPSDTVVDVVEARDGTLWALTRAGLASFDGFRWKAATVPSGLKSPITSISAIPGTGVGLLAGGQFMVGDHDGVRIPAAAENSTGRWQAIAGVRSGPLLLLGYDGGLFEWNGTSIRRNDAAAALGRVRALYQAGQAGVWISTDRGLYCWDGTSWRSRMARVTGPFELSSVVETIDERAWAYVMHPQAARGLWQWDASKASVIRGVRQQIPSEAVSLAVTADGSVLAAHQTGELTVLRNNAWAPLSTRFTEISDAHKLGVRANGDIWVASDHGLFLSVRSVVRWTFLWFPLADGRNGINDIHRDHDGLWLATGNGLVRARRGTDVTEHIDRVNGETLGIVTGVVRDTRDRLWISSGASFAGVRWLDRSGWHRLTQDAVLDRSYIHRVAVDSSGAVWFLGIGMMARPGESVPTDGPGAFRLGPDGHITRWSVAQGLPSGRVYAMAEGPDGALWFGTAGGLSRWFHSRWRHWTTADGLASDRVFGLAVDSSGTAWFGHQNKGGLGRLQGDTLRYFSSGDGLASDDVWSVGVDAKSRVWVSCLGGLSLLENENWTSFDAGAGLRSTRVWPVLPSIDHVYVGTDGGGLAILNLSSPSPPPIVVSDVPVPEANEIRMSWRAFAWWGEMASSDVPTRTRIDDGAWSAWSTERTRTFGSLASGDHVVGIQAKGLLGHPGPVATTRVPIARPFYLHPAFFLPIMALAAVSAGLVISTSIRRRRHRLQLQERERRFSQIFHSSPLASAIASFDEGLIIDINEAFVRTFGYARDEVIGRTVVDINLWLRPEDRSAVLAALGLPGARHSIETSMRCKSGDIADVVVYLERIEIEGKPALVSQTLDVTTERRLEAQLRQAHKMESVGRLAGGVAHDFNNLLTVILGNVSLLDEALEPSDQRRDEVAEIKMAAERAEKLTRQLLAFARKQVVEPRTVSLNDLVMRTDRMLRRLIGEHVELVTIMVPDAAAVFVDPAQIEQVLVNMAINARDAMPDGGTLTIRTANIEITEADPVREPDTLPGAYVRLSVVDTGTGMDKPVADHVFDPFFTTKDAGKGTGLGLATCYGIVKQLRGQITIDTAPGRGTAFHIDLPVALTALHVEDASEPPVELSTGREVVLLVEDEIQVRRLAATILRQRGYVVFEAASGSDALQFEAGYPGRIDLLVTDVAMPQMRGTELATQLRARRSELKVLYVSGYADDQVFHQEAGFAGFAFLAKPFTPASLASKVREQLDNVAGSP